MESEQQPEAQRVHMKKISITMNILMGVSLSCGLSLVGFLASGHFALVPWLISFGCSTVLSLIIGFCVPVRRIAGAVCKKAHAPERSLRALCLDSLISDLIYTPVITLLMVYMAYCGAQRGIQEALAHGAPAESLPQLHFLPMFVHSLIISLVVGYVLIFVLQPLYLRLVTKKLANTH